MKGIQGILWVFLPLCKTWQIETSPPSRNPARSIRATKRLRSWHWWHGPPPRDQCPKKTHPEISLLEGRTRGKPKERLRRLKTIKTLVGGSEHEFYFLTDWEFHYPNWPAHILFSGLAGSSTNHPALFWGKSARLVVSKTQLLRSAWTWMAMVRSPWLGWVLASRDENLRRKT